MRALLLVILVACGGGGTPAPTTPTQPTPTEPTPPAGDEEKFTGTITQINFGCAADASCDLTVDNTRHVHFGHDTRREGPTTWGNTEEIYTLMGTPNDGVGRKVEVYAAKKGEGFTLQGKSDYYIKVLPP